jgi:type VI secretion system protein ImpF
MTASGWTSSGSERALRQAIVDFEPRILPDSVSVKTLLERDLVDHHNVISIQIEGSSGPSPCRSSSLLRTSSTWSGQNRVGRIRPGRR